MTVTSPSDSETINDTFESARDQLRESLAASRALVRQSHQLIELSECSGAEANGEDGPLTN